VAFSLTRVEKLPISFGTYIQYLISLSLDPEFRSCIIESQGKDFFFFFSFFFSFFSFFINEKNKTKQKMNIFYHQFEILNKDYLLEKL